MITRRVVPDQQRMADSHLRETCQAISSINIHRTAAADALSAHHHRPRADRSYRSNLSACTVHAS